MCIHVSQWSTFLYSPRPGIQSSRLNAWAVRLVIQSRRSGRPPGLDKANNSPTHAGGYVFVYSRMRGRAHRSL